MYEQNCEPHENVAHLSSKLFVDEIGDPNSGKLKKNQKKNPSLETSKGNTNYEFMEEGRDEEAKEDSFHFGNFSEKERSVDVSLHPIVNWQVPIAPKITQCSCIPPVIVEVAVPKHCQLCTNVQKFVKENVESYQPNVNVRESEFQISLHQTKQIHFFDWQL